MRVFYAKATYGNKEIAAVNKVLKNPVALMNGAAVKEFEQKSSKLFGKKFGLMVNSGSSANLLALAAFNFKPGSEIITPSLTFSTTVAPIYQVNCVPHFIDVIDRKYIANVDQIETCINKKTVAIMIPNLLGNIADWKKIHLLGKKYKLKIIEDAAQATGAYYKGKHAGTFGKISAFSTHPLKNLNALGDGGFIITSEKKLYDKIKLYRSHGLEGRDDAKIIGVNSRLDSINAEVLSFRLKKLKNIIYRRRKNINYYKKYIKTNKVKILNDKKNEKNAHVMFVTLAENRNKLQEYLKKFNIQSLLYYPTPLHLHNSMKFLGYKKGNLINAEKITSKVISFPHHQHLTEKQIKFVSEKINKFYL